jgi:hypothetical protein
MVGSSMNARAEGFGGGVMEREEKVFDVAEFLKLLGEVMPTHGTGVVNARIHLRDGIPWAVSVQFHNAEQKAA